MFGNDTYTEGDGSRNATRVGGISRRAVLASGAVLGGATLAGCLGGDGGNGDGGQVAIISSDAGFGDNAFNDNALEGLEEAADEFDVEITQVEETETAEFAARQEDLAEDGSYDLIVMVGYQHYEGLVEHSEAYPDQYWMLINDHVEGADNVSGWIEMNNEMSFLAGVAAGTLTHEEIDHEGSATEPDESVVGFAGGEDIDLINAFEQSYIEGVEWVDDSVDVLTGYGGSFSDSEALNDVATSQFDDGADIVWHAAAAAGAGAFAAAEDNDRFAMGVDSDQSVANEQYADVILGSAIKALNEATYQVTEAVVEDDWESVSGEQNLSIEQEGIDYVVGQEFEGEMPDSLEGNLEEAKQAVVDGEVELTCGPTGC
ncbi:BMP family ABC transporter substrate-binding protein [Natronococcus pandeyae]|uniref:BMP family ABC transporter substrate-binding protein n=1 Tax=Natronococcus pandeyae TaxID=2055836 RepID=A0A8J8PZT0_9EURY|nr:BMP family ABC transporter substrate-binding protein [Natronococcus pandeyae]TYL36766.1 BMP family ABC transporter substrate-binding protein [Natronococcus pandeyae]